MDADGLPLVGPGLDYTKIEAITDHTLIGHVNHFVSHTVQFLNHFAVVCEEKLCEINVKIQRLEATASILESKLSFIPGLENVTAPVTTAQPSNPVPNTVTQTVPETIVDSAPPPQQEPPPNTEEPQMTVSQDPRYAPFFKLIKIQVPPGAVKQKMAIAGLNPDLLDTPNAPAPPPDTTNGQSNSDDDLSDQSNSDNDW